MMVTLLNAAEKSGDTDLKVSIGFNGKRSPGDVDNNTFDGLLGTEA